MPGNTNLIGRITVAKLASYLFSYDSATKVAQNIWQPFEKRCFSVENILAIFMQLLGIIGLLFVLTDGHTGVDQNVLLKTIDGYNKKSTKGLKKDNNVYDKKRHTFVV